MTNGLLERTDKFVPAFFADVVDLGTEFKRGDWPLHITLFPPILDRYQKEYGYAMKWAVNPLAPFDVTVGESAMFGPDYDVPVKLLEESLQLHRIHKELVRTVGTLLHDPTFRQPYNPHIAVGSDRTIETGEVIHIGGFSIVEKTISGRWRIVDKIGLKG